jgi:hypothetical protein
LADNYSKTMVYKDTSANGGPRMDVNIGKDLIDPHYETSYTVQSSDVQAVGNTIPKHCPYARIVEKEFNPRADCGVVFIYV